VVPQGAADLYRLPVGQRCFDEGRAAQEGQEGLHPHEQEAAHAGPLAVPQPPPEDDQPSPLL
jgi:hypothetical protein